MSEMIDEKSIQKIKESYSAIKHMEEEKRAACVEIRDKKIECAKATGLSVKDINGIMKVLQARETGSWSDDYNKIAKAVMGL